MFKIQATEVFNNKVNIISLLFYQWEVSQLHADRKPVQWILSTNAQNKKKRIYD